MSAPIQASAPDPCSICLDGYSENPKVVYLHPPTLESPNRISHLFHKNCIETWFGQSNHCPCCREPSRVEDGFEADFPIQGRPIPRTSPSVGILQSSLESFKNSLQVLNRQPLWIALKALRITPRVQRIVDESIGGAAVGFSLLGTASFIAGGVASSSCVFAIGNTVEWAFQNYPLLKNGAKEFTPVLAIGIGLVGALTCGIKGALVGATSGAVAGAAKGIFQEILP